MGAVNFFLGFEEEKYGSGYYLTQCKYTIDLLGKIDMLSSIPSSTSMCQRKKFSVEGVMHLNNLSFIARIIGALQYLTILIPDIVYSVNIISQLLKAPTTNHWSVCMRIMRYLQGTLDQGLQFSQPSPSNALNLIFFL